jgi:hypothetical protein
LNGGDEKETKSMVKQSGGFCSFVVLLLFYGVERRKREIMATSNFLKWKNEGREW